GGAAGTGPAELGGVPVGDWPDACDLLKEPDLAAARLDSYVTEPGHASVGTVKLPHPVSCTYEPPKPKRAGEDGRRGEDGPGKEDEEGREGADGSIRADPDKPDHQVTDPPSFVTGAPELEPGGTPSPRGSAEQEPVVRGLTVSVRWVAPDEASAARLLDALQSTQAQARQRRDIGGDEAYEIGPTAGTIALRVGRLIVVVDANRPPGAAARIASAVVRRSLTPSPGSSPAGSSP
uniref:hypothetical protein n=1 Tax=Actinomadura macra TaxID=46164 RepID=UPI000A4B9504